jgi:hypothetical protein
VSGRNAAARLRSEMRSLPAANCSTMPSANARLPFDGTTMRRPNTSCTSTAAPSASRSTSATMITEFSADSRSAGVPAIGLSFSFSPSGNAVLNFPLRRTASGIGVPEGLKPRVASSPDLVAFMLSTSMALGELCTNALAFKLSGSLSSNAPPKA